MSLVDDEESCYNKNFVKKVKFLLQKFQLQNTKNPFKTGLTKWF